MSPAVGLPMVKQVKPLNCPNCGSTVALRGFGTAINAVCESCHSVLDAANSEQVRVLQQFDESVRYQPLIPLGTRGKFRGESWECIGFQRRAIVVEGDTYAWFEYLLYNPYRGYRYLSEYDGHWTWIKPMTALPIPTLGAHPEVNYGGKVFKQFQTATARTTYVMGEFPFQVRVGDSASTTDYTCPPYSLSVERTREETVWSEGEYVSGAELWQAFKLPGNAPASRGIYFNQPNPHLDKPKAYWLAFAVALGAWLMIVIFLALTSSGKKVFEQAYVFDPQSKAEASFVTPVFTVDGRESNVKITVDSTILNHEMQVDFALINEETGKAYNTYTKVDFYSGTDSDGAWTEGDRRESVTIPSVPAGRYYLRVEPDADERLENGLLAQPIRYLISVQRGTFGILWMLLAALLLPIPPLWVSIQSGSFETARWAESDISGGSTSSSSDDDD